MRFSPHPSRFAALGRTDLLHSDVSDGHGEDGEGNERQGARVWDWTHLHMHVTGLTLRGK